LRILSTIVFVSGSRILIDGCLELLWRNVEVELFDSLFDSDLENTEGQIDDFDLLMSFLLEFWMLLRSAKLFLEWVLVNVTL
jgi:hypothetical protein